MTFEPAVARKLKEELIDIIKKRKDVNEYGMIVYKYVFITELGMPLQEDLGIEIMHDSFILYIIPDNLKFNLLKELADEFKEFEISFMSNSHNLIKLKFKLSDFSV